MNILVVEDDPQVAVLLDTFLGREFPAAEIQMIDTESDFIRRFPEIVASPPVFALVDVMLRWDNSSSESPAVPHDSYRGGFRVVDAFASRPETESVPIILQSGAGLDYMREQLSSPPANVFFLSKPLDLSRFRELIRSLLAASRQGRELLMSSSGASAKKRIFVSYSHKDSKWVKELQVTLRPMLRDEEFLLWNDNQIQAGERWRSQIETELNGASIAILLVSRYFFASDFIAKNELPPLLERAARDGVRILWIAASATDYERSQIAMYQALNDPAHPLDSLKISDRNKELVRIGRVIHEMAVI